MVTIATATNLRFVAKTLVMLRSVERMGGATSSDFLVMGFGSTQECDVIRRCVRRQFKGAEVISVLPTSREFDFIRPIIKEGLWATFTDYLRAWLSKRVGRYLWLDSDVLVSRPIDGLVRLARRSNRLMLAACAPVSPTAFGGRLLLAYIYMYRTCFGELPRLIFDHRGHPLVHNNGVMVIDRDYSEEWRSIHVRIRGMRNRGRVATLLAKRRAVWGQGIWNLLLWAHAGALLPSKYNFYEIMGRGPRVVTHYTGESDGFWCEAARMDLL